MVMTVKDLVIQPSVSSLEEAALLAETSGNCIAGTFKIPVSQLRVDPSYQRSKSVSSIKRTVDEFDPNGLGTIYVSLRVVDGEVIGFILDGQHRWTVVQHPKVVAKYNITELDCKVWVGLTVPQEAGLFVIFNKDRAMPQSRDVVRAWVQSDSTGGERARQMQRILESEGFSLSYNGNPGKNGIQALKACIDIIERGNADKYPDDGEGLLRDTLRVVRSAYYTDVDGVQPLAVKGVFLEAIAMFLSSCRGYIQPAEARRKFGTQTAVQVHREGLAKAQVLSKAVATGIALALIDLYNKQKRDQNRIPEDQFSKYLSARRVSGVGRAEAKKAANRTATMAASS